jgi:hypothetical protein
MVRVRFWSAMVAVAVSSFVTKSRAQTGEPVSIRIDGSVPCTSDADFFERVRRRAAGARSGQADEPTRTFTIRIDGTAPSMQGRLSVVHLDGRSSTREVSGESCNDVVDALALITAVDIDPDAARAAPSEQPVLPPPAPAFDEQRAPTVDWVPASESGPSWHLAAGIEPSVIARVAPQSLVGLPVFVELTRASSASWAPSFVLGFERTLDSTTESQVGDAVFDLVEGFAQACTLLRGWERFWAGPCTRFEVGALQAAGKGGKSLISARPDSGPWLAFGLAGRADFRLAGPVHLGAQIGLGIPLVRYDYRFDPGPSFGEAKPWSWRAGLGFKVGFL